MDKLFDDQQRELKSCQDKMGNIEEGLLDNIEKETQALAGVKGAGGGGGGGSSSYHVVFVLDESDSMAGTPF